MIDSLLLSVAPITSFIGSELLTNATGFFFERDQRIYLVTSRHVMIDTSSDHKPDRIEIKLHNNPDNVAESIQFSIPLFNGGKPNWLEAHDRAGLIDIAVIELKRQALPEKCILTTFTPEHLPKPEKNIEIGSRLLIVGFPLGFHDTLHHTGVVRGATLASTYGLRFQGFGYFLTDARTHRGTSGAPVVIRETADNSANEDSLLPYKLLGVHSSRFDMVTRDTSVDEALGLNCTWYADALMSITEPT